LPLAARGANATRLLRFACSSGCFPTHALRESTARVLQTLQRRVPVPKRRERARRRFGKQTARPAAAAASRAFARLFLLFLFLFSPRAAAVGGVHAAAGFPLAVALPIRSLVAALLLVSAIALVVSHVDSSIKWMVIETAVEGATPVPRVSAHEQEQRAPVALNL
jgi:hypothetical protein